MIYMYVFNSIDSAYLHLYIDDMICLLIDIYCSILFSILLLRCKGNHLFCSHKLLTDFFPNKYYKNSYLPTYSVFYPSILPTYSIFIVIIIKNK